MGKPLPHKKVKLIIGLVFNSNSILKKAEDLIFEKFGPIDLHSCIIGFSHTAYYAKEFGKNLKRKFISLKELVLPEDIYKVKLAANKIENRLSENGRRAVNIDPGYITEGKLVLLTTKDHSHRIYLKKGIYAESTLRFKDGTFLPFETTFPDYKSKDYIDIFNEIRELYKAQLTHLKISV